MHGIGILAPVEWCKQALCTVTGRNTSRYAFVIESFLFSCAVSEFGIRRPQDRHALQIIAKQVGVAEGQGDA